MLVMHFVRPSYCPKINIIAVSKNFKSLMNKNVMDHKIRQSIKSNSHANPEKKIIIVLPPKK
jgi:RNase P protein component